MSREILGNGKTVQKTYENHKHVCIFCYFLGISHAVYGFLNFLEKKANLCNLFITYLLTCFEVS